MKKKNHLKKLALLGITSGLMMASPGQADVPVQAEAPSIESHLASNYNYGYSGNYIRRGNYAYSRDNRGSAESTQDDSFTEFASCAASSHGCGGQSHPQTQLPTQGSGCGGSNGCGGQQSPR
ncbi:hypothetical protein [Parachlamydia sp. AcF125]|uniref:hypothetical protein n=1 Tax=Parachlamydia sp. AcF125 TaxID=2795736 RepID=UPI001BC94F5F|nr:hypothetical protein [Parachlamydia sp. AcF125]MBS4167864.1 hypothetical protein [Parachlamydia sp. AcF125]